MISNEMIYVIGPALLICSMIVLTHVPLGVEVLKIGIIFIDLAVFLRVQFFPAQIKTFYHHQELFCSNRF